MMTARSVEEIRGELIARMGSRGEPIEGRDFPCIPKREKVLSFAIGRLTN